jgi:hypothetical protein
MIGGVGGNREAPRDDRHSLWPFRSTRRVGGASRSPRKAPTLTDRPTQGKDDASGVAGRLVRIVPEMAAPG